MSTFGLRVRSSSESPRAAGIVRVEQRAAHRIEAGKQRLPRRGFERHAVAQARLLGEALEQRRHATHPVAVQVGDAVLAVAHRVGICAESEAVADEQDRASDRGRGEDGGDHFGACQTRT